MKTKKTMIIYFFFWNFIPFILNGQKVEISGIAPNIRVYINNSSLPMYNECPTNIPIDYFDKAYTINDDKNITFPARKIEISRFNSALLNQSFVYIGNICSTLNENGKNWRLPNQKELFIIYILRNAIENTVSFPKFYDYFYVTGLISSTTERQQNKVDMANGNSSSGSPQSGYYIRCVRDVF